MMARVGNRSRPIAAASARVRSIPVYGRERRMFERPARRRRTRSIEILIVEG
jgi:hypothetical protein